MSEEINRSSNDWFYEAKRLAGAKEFDAAFKAYESAIQLDSSFAKAWYYKAELHKKIGQTNEAVECAQKAVELEPKYEAHVAKMLAAQPADGVRKPPPKKESWTKLDHTLDRFYQELIVEGRKHDPLDKPERHMRNVYKLLNLIAESDETKLEHLNKLLDHSVEAHFRGAAFFFDGMPLAEKIASVLAARDYRKSFRRNDLAAPDMVSKTMGWQYEEFVKRIMKESEEIVYAERGNAIIRDNMFQRTGFYFITNETLYIPGSYTPSHSGRKVYFPQVSEGERYHWNLDKFPFTYIKRIDVDTGRGDPKLAVRVEEIPYLFMETKGSYMSNLTRDAFGVGRSLKSGKYKFRLLLHPHRYTNESKDSVKARTIKLAEFLRNAVGF